MKNATPILAALLLCHALRAAPAAAQTITATPAETAAAAERRERATKLLDEVLAASASLRNAANRRAVEARAADLLWASDPARARKLYAQVLDDLRAATEGIDLEDDLGRARYQALEQKRQEVVRSLGQHAPALALERSGATRTAKTAEETAFLTENFDDADTRGQLAMMLICSDPERAAGVAREMLERGYPTGVVFMLPELAARDRGVATKLLASVLSKLRADRARADAQAAGFALALVQVLSQADAPTGDASREPPLLSAQAAREMVELAADAALGAGQEQASQMMANFNTLADLVAKHAPAREAQLRRKFADAYKNYREQQAQIETWTRQQEVVQNGDAAAINSFAAKMPREQRDEFYRQAAVNFISKGDEARARSLVGEHVTDPAARRRMLTELEDYRFSALVGAGKVAEARALLGSVRQPEERAVRLVQLAEVAHGAGDRKLALELLGEADSLTPDPPINARQMSTRLSLASAYGTIDPARAFAIAEPMVAQLNRLIEAGAAISAWNGDESIEDGELNIEGYGAAQQLYLTFVTGAASLARFDFGRTKEMFDRFERPEVRLGAQMILAGESLSDQAIPTGCPGAGGESVTTPAAAPVNR